MTKVLFGGYTDQGGTGVYQAEFDSVAGLSQPKPFIQVGAPTYLQQAGDLLFAIKRLPDQGGVACYSLINGKILSQQLEAGASPAYLQVDPEQQLLFMANYHSGRIAVYHYDLQGQLSLQAETIRRGSSIRPEQTAAHPHFFGETPFNNLVCCDLGTDSLAFYQLQNDQLVPSADLQLPAGSGPRHLVFDRQYQRIYIACELASQVQVVNYEQNGAVLSLGPRYATTAASFHDHNGAAAIRISRDGRFLYVSNRGENSLVVFKITPTGLELIQRISTFGSFPRDFNWDSQQQFVIAANQTSNNAAVYRRNAETGLLSRWQLDVAVPQPTCVLFERS
ncbi:MAG: lactonase family protein [Lactobacillus sp.]|jgi:6-phosphogluconolactonase|nr:lactonase family protein [Lactobacillus sp.]MCH3906610.1 lactonase family protein [Lactobacillus sp.]